MKDLTFDNEENILSYFRSDDIKPLAFPESDEVWGIFQSIYVDSKWSEWTNNSRKTEFPPDFYNSKEKIMLEIMRFDDTARKKGKLNETRAREKQLLNELHKNGILHNFPNLKSIVVNANTSLETEEDHNFKRYRENFARVILSHSKRVNAYRKNHTNYKLIFFVFDESSGTYFETIKIEKIQLNEKIEAKPHLFFVDEEMLDVIKKSGADYLIWYKPFGAFQSADGTMSDEIPKLVIYEINDFNIKPIAYREEFMINSEI